ncbi:unnamed protein product, partial [Prunus brigantina]
MSDTESDCSRSPRAFDGETASESTTEGLDSADFEETERGAPEVSTDSGSTSSVEIVGVNGARPSMSGRQALEAEGDVSGADPGEGVLTVVRGPERIPMAKPTEIVFGVDHLEPNIMTEADLAKIRAVYNIPDSVKMRIPEPLEKLSKPTGETVFFTDVFKHGLRLPLRHSVQKILAAIGYAPGQFNPNFWITLLGTITAFGIAGEGEPKGALRSGGAVVTKDVASASGVGVRSLGIGSGGNLSLKQPIATKREIEVIERVRSRIPEEDRFHKALLDFKNLFRAGLISEPEYLRRKKEEEEKEEEMAGGREMNEATRRRLEARAAQKKQKRPSQPKARTPRPTEGGSAQASTPAERRREKRVAEAELVREAHLQVTGKRMELPEIEQLPMKSLREQAGRALRLQAAKKYEEGRAKIADAGKMLQDADRHAEENAAKIAELSSKLAEAERASVDAEEARARAEAAKEAALRSQA